MQSAIYISLNVLGLVTTARAFSVGRYVYINDTYALREPLNECTLLTD